LITQGLALDGYDIVSLGAFLTLAYRELYLLAFCEGFETVALNSAEVSKNVRAALLLNEAKTFRFVEPLNGAFNCVRHNNFLNFK
jgi:hypothetical protein